MAGEYALPEVENAPVCIAGMHRSGTSTVTQLLHRCGLYLGDENDLFAAGPTNPDGFWENSRFVEINQQLLDVHAGGWDAPPRLPPGWYKGNGGNGLRPQQEAANRLLAGFDGREHWGWKDPRNSLTLPFWLDIMPSMKTVVCMRNPLEVANSLRERGNSSIVFGLNLWKAYNQALLENAPKGRYIVTHYEAYFHRPQEETRRVLDFLGMPASNQLISLVRSRVIRGLRHHFSTVEDLLERDPSGEVGDLYLKLCVEAEWNPEPYSSPVSASERTPQTYLPARSATLP